MRHGRGRAPGARRSRGRAPAQPEIGRVAAELIDGASMAPSAATLAIDGDTGAPVITAHVSP
jgi:hypothetical protein